MLKMPLSLVGVGLMLACSPKTPQATGLEYPSSPQGDVVDIYHGTSVPDPYRWLEDPNSEESRVWIEAQNALTYAWLEEIPQRPSSATAWRPCGSTSAIPAQHCWRASTTIFEMTGSKISPCSM